MEILKYVDVIIGLALVMVLASTVVAAATQLITSASFARSRYLRDGLASLIRQLDRDPNLEEQARYIAELVLRHPMIARSNSLLGFFTARLRNWARTTPLLKGLRQWLPQLFSEGALPRANAGSVIEREELVRVLLEWAAGEGPLHRFASDPANQKACKALEALRSTLQKNGISEPSDLLKAIRRQSLTEEQANPELPSTQWQSQAILTTAVNDFTGKILAWYDNTMARVSQHFTLEAKVWTSLVALLVVVAIQLDSAQLLRRLSSDDKYRQALVEQAKTLDGSKANPDQRAAIDAALAEMREPALAVIPDHLVWQSVEQGRYDPKSSGLPGNTATPAVLQIGSQQFRFSVGSQDPLKDIQSALSAQGVPVRAYIQQFKDQDGQSRSYLQLAAKSSQPTVLSLQWNGVDRLSQRNRRPDWSVLWPIAPGLLLSWVLVSLGAPFWYDVLKNALKFRSVIAQKENDDRQERQQTSTPVVPVRAVTAPVLAPVAVDKSNSASA